MKTKPIASYPGGKDAAGSCERILALMPAHSVYVEPFLGGGAVLRRKKPALRSIGVELDGAVVASWRAAAWPGLELIEGCGIEWLESEGLRLPPDALVYADPPYLHGTRSHRRIYGCELSDGGHARLLAALLALPCSVMVSGYWSELYAARLAGWTLERWDAMTRGGMREECLWVRSSMAAFAEPEHAGRGFRERERIRRKAARWAENYRRLSPEERNAVLSAMLRAA